MNLKNKKILFLVGNLNNSGGTERVCSIIANELSCIDNYEVSITSITEGEHPFFPLSKRVKTHSLLPISTTRRTIYRTPAIIYKLRSHLVEKNIDTLIVVETMSVLFTLPAVQGLSINHICWEHFSFNNDLGKYGRKLARKLAAKYCNSVVVLTESDQAMWLNNTSHKSQIVSIPNPSPYSIQNISREKDNKTVLAVGRLTHIKGFDLLLKAWINIYKHYPDWKLIIVGEGEDRVSLQEFIDYHSIHDSVQLVGNTNLIEQYYRNADIFCLSSRAEGFGMVLVEALSFGLPIISFNCDFGPKEILKDTESVIVPIGNTTALSKELLKLIEDKNKRSLMSISSRNRASRYHPKKIIDMWINIIEKS